MGILQLLARQNYITYHKTLAKEIGVDEAILFGELCSMSDLYGEEFFCEQSKLMNDTCLTEYRIRNALKNLQKAGLVSIKKKGLPAKNYYVLNEKNLLKLLERHRTSGAKFDTTGNSNFDTTGSIKIDTTFNKNTDSKNTRSKNTDYIHIKDMYNDTCVSLPRVTILSDKRKRAIKIITNNYSIEQIEEVFRKTEASNFLTGKSERKNENHINWQANFDWLMKDSNFAKVLDGNYDNRGNQNDYAALRDYSDLEGYF